MDFKAYLADKNKKLGVQREHALDSNIFEGVTVYITGHTIPSAKNLMELVTANGGNICNFYTGQKSATHIIAESLTSRKCELWKHLAVAKPQWIVDSVSRGKKLQWTDYRTIQTPINEKKWILDERQRVNCLDPHFLAEYYKNSRLHFLSTRKRLLRQRTLNIGEHTPHSGRQVILHIDFDSFFVACALLKHPDLADKPVCVSHGTDSSDIASCNYVAREKGVKNGMWVGPAKKICPELICLKYDFPTYEQFSDALYSVIINLTPDYICPVSVDEALVNVTNHLRESKRGVQSVINEIRSRVKQLTGINVSVGAGPNILLAKLALRLAKPNGFRVFKTEEEAYSTVSDLAVESIPGVGKVTLYKLRQLGVEKIVDIQKCTFETLELNLGIALAKKLFDATLAKDSNDISTLNLPARTVGVDVAWGVRLISAGDIDLFATNMVNELWERREKDFVPVSISIKVYEKEKDAPFLPPKYMGCGPCDVHNRTVRLDTSPTKQELCAIIIRTLKQLAVPPLRFRGLGLQLKCSDAEPTTPQHSRQRFINEYERPSTPTTPSKREFISLQPKRKSVTLTQMAQTERLDMDVFNGLPDDIKEEVVKHAGLFNLRISKEQSGYKRKKQRLEQPTFEEYMPLPFFGEVRSEQDIRAQIKRWVEENQQGPFHEDAVEFYEYIQDVLTSDWNWLKALQLIDWLQFQVSKLQNENKWNHYIAIIRELII